MNSGQDQYPEHLLVRGDAKRLALADQSVQVICTSPPYFGLRSYLDADDPNKSSEIGAEATPDEFVAAMVAVFRELWRVLRDNGCVFANIGDSYCNAGTRNNGTGFGDERRGGMTDTDGTWESAKASYGDIRRGFPESGIKKKDRMFIPHRVVLALQADGWYARDEIIWSKPAPMPESVTDRTTKAHEIVFLLTKQPDYFYDAVAIKEPMKGKPHAPGNIDPGKIQGTKEHQGGNSQFRDSRNREWGSSEGSNRRSVWTIANTPCDIAHFATMPEGLAEICIKAGSSEYGACRFCRSPYERITERTKLRRERPNDYVKRTGESGTGNSCSNSVAGTSVKTLGWQQTCNCPPAPPVPCIVYDPFAGASTTLLVANRLGRHAVGCDLNQDYLILGQKRIADGLRPRSRLDAAKAVKPQAGQLSLFGDSV